MTGDDAAASVESTGATADRLAHWRAYWQSDGPPLVRPRSDAPHADYPHTPGYLIGCPGCEARCHCTPGNAECVFDGYHIEWCRTCEEATLDDGEGWDGECGNCADRTYARERCPNCDAFLQGAHTCPGE